MTRDSTGAKASFTGRVRMDPTPGRGAVPRDDVAAALGGLLHDERAAQRVLYVNGGDQPLDQALEAVLGAWRPVTTT
jgi:hypothetical protein